jgi:arginyl-tRNA synthetase
MQTIIHQLETAFRKAIRDAFNVDVDPILTVSQNEKFGDYQSNAAMGLAKQVKSNPRAVAEQIKSKLDLGAMASEVSIAGPGFINVRLSPNWLAAQFPPLTTDGRLGLPLAPSRKKVVVDYSGPNIAKEMHVGHLRSTIIGDALARVLEFQGHQVIRQNHIGDWGLQMGMVTYALEREGARANDLTLGDLARLYREINTASKDPGMRRQMAERTRALQQTPKSELAGWQRVRDLTLASAHDMYRQMGVTLTENDVRGESAYSDDYAAMIDQLIGAGHAVETEAAIGIFPPGFVNKEGERRPFLIRSRDGSYQYPTFDLAALTYRIKVLGAQWIIYTHDARQAEHFAMLFAVATLIGLNAGNKVRLDFAPFGTVLGEDGTPIKTREGEPPRLKDLLDEADQHAYSLVTEKNPDLPEDERRSIAHAVGTGAVKYADLSKERTSDYIFSFDRMLSMDGNTAPYLQYAHARIKSIFRKAGTLTASIVAPKLESPFEIALAKHVLRLGEIIELIARELKPHYLCTYLYELATKFSSFYENCPVIQSEEPTRSSRLLLCDATAKTLALGLDLLGIEHPEQM